MKLKELSEIYYRELFNGMAPDDYSNNGIQVEATTDVTSIAFSLDACMDTINLAAQAKVDLLVVHHGISWGTGFRRLDGYSSKRIDALYRNGISLFAMHLPLDMHPLLGINVELARMLNLVQPSPFFTYHGEIIGRQGLLPQPQSAQKLAQNIGGLLNAPCRIPVDSGREIRTIGIVGGGGDDAIFECANCGLDALLTGEFSHKFYHPAKELGLTVFAAGHYATEAPGPKALMAWTQKHVQLPCQFLEVPTGC